MRKFAFLAMLGATVCVANADSLKSTVEAMNKKVNAAIVKLDVKAFVAATKPYCTKDFKHTEYGRSTGYDEMVATMKTGLASIKKMKSSTTVVKKVEEKGGKGTVWTVHRSEGTMMGPDKKAHKFTMDGESTSTYVKEGKVWKVSSMTWTKSDMKMDGKTFDPSKMGGG